MLTLRQIEVFRAVMQAGTISAAAERLRVSQPTLTKTLSRMEQLTGLTLFRRAAGRLVPTLEARRLMAETEASYTELQHAIRRVVRRVHADEGTLRVGAQPSLTRKLAAPALAASVRELPKAAVHLDTAPVLLDPLALLLGLDARAFLQQALPRIGGLRPGRRGHAQKGRGQEQSRQKPGKNSASHHGGVPPTS